MIDLVEYLVVVQVIRGCCLDSHGSGQDGDRAVQRGVKFHDSNIVYYKM